MQLLPSSDSNASCAHRLAVLQSFIYVEFLESMFTWLSDLIVMRHELDLSSLFQTLGYQ